MYEYLFFAVYAKTCTRWKLTRDAHGIALPADAVEMAVVAEPEAELDNGEVAALNVQCVGQGLLLLVTGKSMRINFFKGLYAAGHYLTDFLLMFVSDYSELLRVVFKVLYPGELKALVRFVSNHSRDNTKLAAETNDATTPNCYIMVSVTRASHGQRCACQLAEAIEPTAQ